MKKLCILLVLGALLFLCSCRSQPEPVPPHIAGVLYFTDKSETYSGCALRAQEVITALTEKVNLLVEQNNAVIKSRESERYFLEPDYILTNFIPFASDYFQSTLGFADSAEKTGYSAQVSGMGEGASTWFEKTDKNAYRLIVEDEQGEFTLCGEYSRKHNSLSFTRKVSGEDGESVAEFLDFVYVEGLGYYLQNQRERCVIDFSENGSVTHIYYSCLADGQADYPAENESVYPQAENIRKLSPAQWVSGDEKSRYTCIYTYSDGVLKYEDCSSGEWKTVSISEQSDK